MALLVVFLTLIVLSLLCVCLVLWRKLRAQKLSAELQQKSLHSVIKIINSVRYGNLYERVSDDVCNLFPNFAQSINSMIDAIADREDMIKEYQTDLNKKIDTLQEVEQLKEDFVATLTHDLKVPIMAEKNMLSFLLNNRFGELNDYQKEALTHLQNSNRELVELVEIILETYKFNETQIEMKPIYESDSIQVNFFTEFDGDVSMDKFYVKRVLKNLILNAISFSEPYSKIDTAVCIDEKNVFIKITNYGKGIKKEELKHIFDKYYTTAKKFRKVGTGLGLYLSNKIVKEHKGRIMVESQNDDWTTFAIVLPR